MPPPAPRSRWLLAALLALPLRAADAPKPAAIGVMVADVMDTRGPNAPLSSCRVTLKLSGDAINDAYSIRRVRLMKAQDELGRDLLLPDPTNGLFEPAPSGLTPSPYDEQRRLAAVSAEIARRRMVRETTGRAASSPAPVLPLTASAGRPLFTNMPTIKLRNPSRQSATIQVVEGEIELFTPTEANGGIVRVPNVTANHTAFASSDALKAAGVRLMYLKADTYAANRESLRANGSDGSGPWSDDVANQIRIFAEGSAHPPLEFFFVDDPNQVVVDLEMQNKDGKRLNAGAGLTGLTSLRVLNFETPPPADAQLVVHLASPGALKTYPFKLEHVPLP